MEGYNAEAMRKIADDNRAQAAAAERAKVLAFIKDRENLSRAKHVRGDQVLMELAEALQALAHHEGEAG